MDKLNIDEDNKQAKSLYHVQEFKEYMWSEPVLEKFVKGEIVVADWNDDWDENNKPSFSYDSTAFVDVTSLDCNVPAATINATVLRGAENEDPWGIVRECEQGPATAHQNDSQPAILLTEDDTDDTYVVVEETAERLSFLYSVWCKEGTRMVHRTAADNTDESGADDNSDAGGVQVQLEYKFHIESTVRLAEAVVTGIVNGVADGERCFRLLREYSRRIGQDGFKADNQYLGTDGFIKAKPFGENPKLRDPVNLQDVETIEAGVGVGALALGSFVVLLTLSFIGIFWASCLYSSTPIDVYDRYDSNITPNATHLQHFSLNLPVDPEVDCSHCSGEIPFALQTHRHTA